MTFSEEHGEEATAILKDMTPTSHFQEFGIEAYRCSFAVKDIAGAPDLYKVILGESSLECVKRGLAVFVEDKKKRIENARAAANEGEELVYAENWNVCLHETANGLLKITERGAVVRKAAFLIEMAKWDEYRKEREAELSGTA